jgi:hypothetical protein
VERKKLASFRDKFYWFISNKRLENLANEMSLFSENTVLSHCMTEIQLSLNILIFKYQLKDEIIERYIFDEFYSQKL